MAEENGTKSEELDPALKEWTKREEKLETEELRAQLDTLKGRPQKTCLHRLFNLISFLTGLAALLMMTGQIVGLYFYEVDPIQGVIRCYVILMCLIIILNELEWTKFIRESAILRIWITRGIFYSFVGALGLEENDTETTDEQHTQVLGRDQALIFIQVVAYIMVGCGILYLAMGCICLQLVRNRVVTDYEQRCSEAKTNRKRTKEGSIV